ncbi:MAG: hypothetical protein AMXMBFR66_28470 [Pseudomonadota bacterium]
MPNWDASFSSSIQLPGSSSRAKIFWRNRSATSWYSARGASGLGDVEAAVSKGGGAVPVCQVAEGFEFIIMHNENGPASMVAAARVRDKETAWTRRAR